MIYVTYEAFFDSLIPVAFLSITWDEGTLTKEAWAGTEVHCSDSPKMEEQRPSLPF